MGRTNIPWVLNPDGSPGYTWDVTAGCTKCSPGCDNCWALVIKAKLEAVDAGISTFEDEFMAAVMLPDGSTVGDYMIPQIEQVYQTGQMPELIPSLKALPGR